MSPILCPCNSGKSYETCCEPFLLGIQKPDTPEALMRSRYTAYFYKKLDYIQKTMKGPALAHFDFISAKNWADSVRWLDLKIISSSFEAQNSDIGYVEFMATYLLDGQTQVLHENSEFVKENGEWFYVDGQIF